jgi:MarR-like DNA-binding transcriptional regulator SgrR of sgrS sRNA
MKKKLLPIHFVAVVLSLPLFAAEGKSMNQVRTYMPFTFPADPARITTIADMDMSYALASTLVEWNAEKQITAGIAESWRVMDPKTYRFAIRKGTQWSDGTPVTSQQVKMSIDRGMKKYADDQRSLINLIETIECPSDREVDFKLKIDARDSGLLGKLTEPNFGILQVDVQGNVDTSVSTGAFYLAKQSTQQELRLVRNQHWLRNAATENMPNDVIIRRSAKDMDSQTLLLADEWPNLIETSSLISDELLGQYAREHYEVWRRPIDKIYYIHPGKRNHNADGYALIRFLQQKMDMKEVLNALGGCVAANQMFPKGYQLHNPNFLYPKTTESLPDKFKGKPLDVLVNTRMPVALRDNIRRAILKATHVEPRFTIVSLEKVNALKIKGDFDLYAGTNGLADPDPEGIMSFLFESDTPVISSNYSDFLEQLDRARKEKTNVARLEKMRVLLGDALRGGYILPLFYLSTIGIGRGDLDFSQVPTSDESVTLSKIRFRRGSK